MSTTIEASGANAGIAKPPAHPGTSNRFALIGALGIVWVLWGSTFAGMRFGLTSFPPYVLGSVRFLISGALLWLFCLAIGRGRPTRRDVRNAIVTGTTLLLLGNGVTIWVVQYLPTGITSLLLALSPVWMAVFDFVLNRKVPTRLAIFGMALGLAGMVLLLAPKGGGVAIPLVPAMIAIGASISWAFGSMLQRRDGVDNLLLATGMQMLVGGALLGIEATLFGQWHVDVRTVAPQAWFGLGWLVVFGGLIAYSAYLYTMQKTSTAVASTYAYVNPVVSIILGIVLFHEHLTAIEATASVVILAGVAVMMIPRRVAVSG